MRKKVLALCLAGILAATSLVACGEKKETNGGKTSATKPTYAADAKIKLWGSQEDQKMLKQMVEGFKTKYPEAKDWTIDLSVVSAADAKNELLKDPTVAADVFEFASDQITELKVAGALYRVTKNKEEIVKNNLENSVAAATVDGELYGYPNTSNSFFLYYDKSQYKEDEVKNINSMLDKKLDKGVTNFSMDVDNGWYTSSFFFGAGCKLFGDDGSDATQCDFNNENGILAGKFLIDLANHKNAKNQDDALLLASFKDRKLGASVTGTWNAAVIKEYLGDDFGVTTLPTFTAENGTELPMSSIVNFNVYGVNAQTKYPTESMLLAEYLTSEECQKIRFEVRSSSPTNLNLIGDEALLSTNEAVAVLSEQVKTSTIQPSIPQIGNFWTPLEALGQDIIAKKVTKDNIGDKLNTMVTSILTKLGE